MPVRQVFFLSSIPKLSALSHGCDSIWVFLMKIHSASFCEQVYFYFLDEFANDKWVQVAHKLTPSSDSFALWEMGLFQAYASMASVAVINCVWWRQQQSQISPTFFSLCMSASHRLEHCATYSALSFSFPSNDWVCAIGIVFSCWKVVLIIVKLNSHL